MRKLVSVFVKWYGIPLLVLAGFGVGFFLRLGVTEGWRPSGIELAGLVSGGGAVGFLLRLWIDRITLSLAHSHRIIEEKAGSFHISAEQYYMPMVARAQRLKMALSSITYDASQEELDICFFRLVQWMGALKEWMVEKGGTIFLRDLRSEDLVGWFLGKIQECFSNRECIGIVGIFRIMEVADSNKCWSELQKEAEGGPLESVKKQYQTWLGQRKDVLPCTAYLGCFRKILTFEANLTMAPWYGTIPEPPSFEDNEYHAIANGLNEVCSSEEEKSKYLRKLGLAKRRVVNEKKNTARASCL